MDDLSLSHLDISAKITEDVLFLHLFNTSLACQAMLMISCLVKLHSPSFLNYLVSVYLSNYLGWTLLVIVYFIL